VLGVDDRRRPIDPRQPIANQLGVQSIGDMRH
jgi:hypothetical protein